MATVQIKAEPRVAGTKGDARQLRMGGKIPAVVYGHDEVNIAVALDAHSFGLLLLRISSGNQILDLQVEGRPGPELKVLIKEVQRHPVDEKILHVDLHHIDMTHKVRVQVPIHLLGGTEAPGLKEGGILEHLLRELEVECLPEEIPAEVKVDVSFLEVNQSIHVRDIELPGLQIHDKEDTVVAMIMGKSKAREAEEAAEDAAAAAAASSAAGGAAPATPADGASS